MEKVNDLERRTSWMIQVGPNPNDKYSYKKHTEERHREKTRPYKNGGRNGVI